MMTSEAPVEYTTSTWLNRLLSPERQGDERRAEQDRERAALEQGPPERTDRAERAESDATQEH